MSKTIPSTLTTSNNGIGRIIFRNPDRRNAITQAMWADLAAAAKSFAADADIRVVIIRGEGELAFSAGADISEFDNNRREPAQIKAYNETIQEAIEAIEAIPVPVVALVHSLCIGGGTAAAIACDLRYFADDAQFGIPAVRLGVGYDPRWVKRLVDAIGSTNASSMLLTGRRFSAQTALRIGLATEVYPKADLDALVEDIVLDISTNAPLSLRAAKKAIRESLAFDKDRDWITPFEMIEICAHSKDYLRALDAFSEKEKAVFNGD